MERIEALTAADVILHPQPQGERGREECSPFLLNDTTQDLQATAPVPIASTSGEVSGRCLDVVIALTLLICTLPLMGMCAIGIALSSRGPVFFRQLRIGRNGREFHCLKFRTMFTNADALFQEALANNSEARDHWAAVQKLKHDPRVTPIGRFLRRYCLDELPQLFNVLAGEMSIVGPRPIVAAEITRYGPCFLDYCSVKPGLTGLWQVSGRHQLSYDERVRLDSQYVLTKSATTDLLILWRTVPIVLFGMNE